MKTGLYPRSETVSYLNESLQYSSGFLHLLDTTNDLYDIVQSYKTGMKLLVVEYINL